MRFEGGVAVDFFDGAAFFDAAVDFGADFLLRAMFLETKSSNAE